MSGLLFNTLFNMNKFLAYENRDPFAMRAEQMNEEGGQSDWDRCGERREARAPCPALLVTCGRLLTDARLRPPSRRFARQEYLRLAVEDDADDMQVDGGDDLYLGQMDGSGGRFI